MTEEQFNMNYRRDLRNKEGNVPKTAPARGSYAEQRIQELRREREKYNVNDLGYYNGGVPRRNRGSVRGNSLGYAGEFHSPQQHNYMNFSHADSNRVTSQDVVQFQHFMTSDKADFIRTRPGYPMFYDRDNSYVRDRDFWLKMLVGMALGDYLYKRYYLEVDRSRRSARMNGYVGEPAHWFNNRGGVVV